MRMTRIIAAVVAFALVALAPLTLTTGAASAADAAESAVAAKKPRHIGFATGKEIRNTNRFVTYGKWTTFKGKKITVQRRACGSCDWKFYKTTRTTANKGKFRTRIAPGKRGSKVCYRVVVRKTSKYRTTRDVAGCITTS